MHQKATLKRSSLYLSFVTVLLASPLLRAQPVILEQPTSQAVWAGSNVTFTVSVAGTGPLAYHWQFNGTDAPVSAIISTVVGNGTPGFLGDDGAATNAELASPASLTVDAAGALYIADTANNRIRKVDTNGVISTVAGGGTGGDGGLATQAKLASPQDVVLDASGNLYIADAFNHRIRKVDTNGVITTVAGTNTYGYSGDGGAATLAKLNGPGGLALDAAGNLYIADTSNYRIRKVDTNGIITTVAGNGASGFTGDGGAATNASFYSPSRIAFDLGGNLYIADSINNRLRKVDTNGIITRVAGPGSGLPNSTLGDGGPATNAFLSAPRGLSLDPANNLYIADSKDSLVRKVDAQGIITRVAGRGAFGYSGDGGSATNAVLNTPSGVALDSAGNLYIADTANNRIRKVALGGAPTLTLTNVDVNNVGNYAVVVSDAGGSVTSSIVSLSLEGAPVILSQPARQAAWVGSNVTFAVSATGSTPLSYQWYWNGATPLAEGTTALLQLNGAGSDQAGSYTVVVTNSYGSVTSSVAALTVNQLLSGPANQTVLAGTPVSLSVQVSGGGPLQYQWQCNGTNIPNNIIRTVAGRNTAGPLGDGGPATNATLSWPGGIRFDSGGNLYIADANSRIRKVDTSGIITTVAGNGTNADSGDGGWATNASITAPNDLCFDLTGNLYIADGPYVRKVDTNGIITTAAATSHSSGLCTDSLGRLYITDYLANRVLRLDTNGTLTTVAGGGSSGLGDGGQATSAQLNKPTDVAMDLAGNLYITDSSNYRVRKVDAHGIITTVAGNGHAGYSGDGGPATAASLNWMQLITVDAQGNLYIADCNNHRIRKVDTSGIITTIAGNGKQADTGDGGPATNASICQPYGLALDAAGNLFLSDGTYTYGYVREVLLAGEPTLTLNNPALANAGTYQVIITSPSGSLTSQVATLTVQVRPAFTSIVPQPDGTVALSLSGTPNSTNRVWVASDLTPPVNWVPLSTNAAGADGAWQLTDTQAPGSAVRFYRVSMP